MDAKSGSIILLFLFSLCGIVNAAEEQKWTVNAIVENPHLTPNSVMLQHEAVKGLMPAMTMPFGLESTNLIEGINVGDKVKIEFIKRENHFFITQLTLLEAAKIKPPPQDLTTTQAWLKVEIPWHSQLVDTEHRQTTLEQYRNNRIVVNFIYTRCPTVCPMQTAALKALYKKLGKSTNDIMFVSITLDPAHDTPERLKQFAQSHQINTKGWTFLTGKHETIQRLLNRFNIHVSNKDRSEIDHGSKVYLISNKGTTIRDYDGSYRSITETLFTDINKI